ncbi:hypothetical protein IC607_10295 [Cellulomonas sp. JH27-2]|uniref:hypothetical protein n=1 Tax=Cellulomonas sp. JH27-2 TaxID=2774139 RepID=UPI001784A3DC|nr:hypothetical protein [Cellulomonas sp. JH27-2]MBD8059356.1 hypothetical protein [Cellulomonas sp. JH27-2]
MSDVWAGSFDTDLDARRQRVQQGIAEGRARSARRRQSRAARAARRRNHDAARGWLLRVSGAWHVAR